MGASKEKESTKSFEIPGAKCHHCRKLIGRSVDTISLTTRTTWCGLASLSSTRRSWSAPKRSKLSGCWQNLSCHSILRSDCEVWLCELLENHPTLPPVQSTQFLLKEVTDPTGACCGSTRTLKGPSDHHNVVRFAEQPLALITKLHTN